MSERFILAKSKENEITDSGACGGAVSSIFQYLLANELVDGVLTLNKGIDVYDGVPRLLTSAEKVIETCGSLHCAPTMVSDLISDFLTDEKIALKIARTINKTVTEHEKDTIPQKALCIVVPVIIDTSMMIPMIVQTSIIAFLLLTYALYILSFKQKNSTWFIETSG